MKKTIVSFIVSALVLASLALWALKGHLSGNTQEILMAGIVLVLVGFAIYLWLFIMYVSDKTSLEAHSLVGGGILGMAVIFLFCWLGVKTLGMKNV